MPFRIFDHRPKAASTFRKDFVSLVFLHGRLGFCFAPAVRNLANSGRAAISF